VISKLIKKFKDKVQESKDLSSINPKSIEFAIQSMMPKEQKARERKMEMEHGEEKTMPKEQYETSEEKEEYKPMGKHMGMTPENKIEIELMINGAKKKKKAVS
jgi:hypothetical protein